MHTSEALTQTHRNSVRYKSLPRQYDTSAAGHQYSPSFHPSFIVIMQAPPPSYTAVAARHTLSRPRAPSPEPVKKTPKFSAEVRSYVQRAFEAGAAIPGIDNAAMQEKLRLIITEAGHLGQLDTIDWSTYPLPQEFIKRERDQAAMLGAQNAQLANNYIGTGPTAWNTGSNSPAMPQMRKRKSPETEVAEVEERDDTPPAKRKPGKNGLQDRITGLSKAQEKKQKKLEAMRATTVEVTPDMIEKRRQRFGHVVPLASPYVSSRDESPVPSGPVVGTCQTLEKNYFRLTAPPAAETVRPLAVLEKALDLVRKKWKKEHNYSYACDQLKSLRQDLTVQHIKNDFTVKVYEAHARIALEMADLGEYNQCQTQLRALYKLNLGGNPEEFVAYRILYFIYTCNRTDMNDVLADLTPADKQKPGVQHALQVRSALASGNYHKFFRLYDEAPFMGPYLLDMFIKRERLKALAAICRTYVLRPIRRHLWNTNISQIQTRRKRAFPRQGACIPWRG